MSHCSFKRWLRWYQQFLKILILKANSPSLYFHDTECDNSTLGCAYGLKICVGTIFGPEHDGPRVLRKFETFGKFRNKVWVPPVKSENFRLKSTNGFVEGTVGKFNVASIQNQSSKLRAYHNLKLSLISSYQFIMGVENFTVCYTPEKLWFQCNCVLAMS